MIVIIIHTLYFLIIYLLGGDLILVSTTSGNVNGLASAGRLELFYDGRWMAVCNNSFNPNDAVVACRQLGYSDYTQYGTAEALGRVLLHGV